MAASCRAIYSICRPGTLRHGGLLFERLTRCYVMIRKAIMIMIIVIVVVVVIIIVVVVVIIVVVVVLVIINPTFLRQNSFKRSELDMIFVRRGLHTIGN